MQQCVRTSYQATMAWHAQQKVEQQSTFGDKPGTLRHPVSSCLTWLSGSLRSVLLFLSPLPCAARQCLSWACAAANDQRHADRESGLVGSAMDLSFVRPAAQDRASHTRHTRPHAASLTRHSLCTQLSSTFHSCRLPILGAAGLH